MNVKMTSKHECEIGSTSLLTFTILQEIAYFLQLYYTLMDLSDIEDSDYHVHILLF